jgi:hypothetical protein
MGNAVNSRVVKGKKSLDYDEREAIRDKEVLINEINILIGLFDKYFPRISANFRK